MKKVLLLSVDAGPLNIHLLLDLTVAFATVNTFSTEHFITLGNHESFTSPVNQGVPQGSVLSLLLFIIYSTYYLDKLQTFTIMLIT